MAARQDHTLLLDQLQEQVNLVLENTGKLFAAAHANPKIAPVAQSAQLRRVLPSATIKFHEALDKLEDELQLAKAVMCRDLAVWREGMGNQIPEAPTKLEEDVADEMQTDDAPAEVEQPKADDEIFDGKQEPNEDVQMQDVTEQQSESLPVEPVDATEATVTKSEANDSTDMNQEESDTKKPNIHALHLDTKQSPIDNDNQDNSDDKPPDTTDLDSLFNDTLSASGNGNGNEGKADADADADADGNGNESFNFEDATAGDFDFDSFSANLNASTSDNDNLLTGIQDYANMQPNGSNDLDLNALFGNTDAEPDNEGAQQAGADGEGEHRDSTFDDLFDMANFDTGDDGNAGGDGNDDLDFNSMFN